LFIFAVPAFQLGLQLKVGTTPLFTFEGQQFVITKGGNFGKVFLDLNLSCLTYLGLRNSFPDLKK
jgi:hypothetical protein